MVPVLLSPTQISQLLQKLEAFGDQSFQVRSIILLQRQYPFEQFQVWVDDWPEFTTALLKQKLPGMHTHNYYVFTLVMENLWNLLQNNDIMEWKNAIFGVYPCALRQILIAAAYKRGFRMKCSRCIFNIFKFSSSSLKQRRVPENFTVESLTLDMADVIAKNWPGSYIHQDKTMTHIKYLIATYPSVCLYNSKGTPVAYELGQEYGGIGMLYVEPTYRNQGLGKLVTTLLVQKYLERGFVPFVLTSSYNEVSIKLHVNMGFVNIDDHYERAKVIPK